MKQFFVLTALLCMCVLSFTSCEKPVLINGEEEAEVIPSNQYRVTFKVSQFEQIPFNTGVVASRAVRISDVCTRISFAVFQRGSKVKTIHQDTKAANFGTVEMGLGAGTYQVVVVAHSGDGSATITSPEEISFSKNKLTDMFYFYHEIDVDESTSYSLEMKRAVAMFRLKLTDDIPSSVKKMRFYYTGGSSTLNAVTGAGAKNSRQTEERVIASGSTSYKQGIDVFTIPHTETDELKMTITALDGSDNVITERIFEEVPVRVNEITVYEGVFFGEVTQPSTQLFTLVSNDEWSKTVYQY